VARLGDRLAAAGYALAYDAVVRGFRPFQTLLDDIARYTSRAGTGPLRVLDVSCGVGTLARRLARDGHDVVGVDAVAELVRMARRRPAPGPGRCRFHHVDVARVPAPGAGTFDEVVSLHTVYWHPLPDAVLAACQRALRPGGHAIILAYARQARVRDTFRAVRAREGTGAAVHALRWLLPTALFERLRTFTPRYFAASELDAALRRAGFTVLETKPAFVADLSLLAWARSGGHAAPPVS
jgi:SAM-dependent methyltransferase